MKNTWAAAAITIVILTGCGNANDGNPATDTTTFDNATDTGIVPGPYGDTTLNMAPSTDTTSQPYSGANSDTAKGNNAASGNANPQ